MNSDRRTIILPVTLITVGVGWLLSNLGVVPQIDWIWTLGLAAIGILTIALGGVDKATVVIGPFFLITSVLSVLRQSDRLPLNVEVPILVIVLGLLFLIIRHPRIPKPTWLISLSESQAPNGDVD